jgi:hypothetical protein
VVKQAYYQQLPSRKWRQRSSLDILIEGSFMEWVGSIFTAVINGGWKIYLAALIASAALIFFA